MYSPVFKCHQKSPSLRGREANRKAKTNTYTSKVRLSVVFIWFSFFRVHLRPQDQLKSLAIRAPISSNTPIRPRSDTKSTHTSSANKSTINMVSVLRLITRSTAHVLRIFRFGCRRLSLRLCNRLDSTFLNERNEAAAAEPNALRIFPGSIGFDN